ncbi:kinase-like protein [Sodiomyces alkalinus F11]|uniref:EKC/KEOPS complex subunit BUD32 n=1 Tax=Sodiomyces alkalinus (strain CBS 110278 / VKM F-3762 / F11) TaxID=1314773 RepID=A0A3N2PMH9_SODAK|nr:kinase-like protein [Sodiomyces alkalinus F11]ROT35679.1 kinase-like protein [Sodiomyces alkalinus F11]
MERVVRVDIPPRIDDNAIVGTGLSSWVLRVDAVAKCYTNPDERDREVAIYERLGRHKSILPYYGTFEASVLLQFASHGTVRQYLDCSHNMPPLAMRLLWAEQVTEAISFLHSKGIFHCDISYDNIFLDASCNALLGDFAGSSIDEKEPFGWYGTSHSHPDAEEPSIQSEIFALGSTFFEIMTGKNPFEGRKSNEVERAIRSGDFPSLDHLPALRTVVSNCWRGEYATANELLQEVRDEAGSRCLLVDQRQEQEPHSCQSCMLRYT